MRFAVVGALVLAGCNPSFAPPIRAFSYGAPARLEQGRVEVGGTAGGLMLPTVGGPHLAYGITDFVAVEAGGNFDLFDGDRYKWALGFAGLRLSTAPHREQPVHWIGDLEVGAGAGVGGMREGNDPPSKNCTDCDGLSATDRIAYGAYQGLGGGIRAHWFSIYARVRLEESTATHVPVTLWPSVSLGLEADIKHRAAIGVSGGYMGYTNSRDSENFWFWQVGVSVFFDTKYARRKAPPAATPPRPLVPQEEWDEPRPVEEEEPEKD